MNIFYLSQDLPECARFHVNSHVVKMITEQNQLLCSAHWMTGNQAPYKLTHKNHPSAIWTRASKDNYEWLALLTIELNKEYTYRYGKIHAGDKIAKWCYENIPNLPNISWTQPTPAMPDEFKIPNNSLESYRNYYRTAKKHLHIWKNREIPFWL